MREIDPLMRGTKRPWGISVTEALRDAVVEGAKAEGYRSASAYAEALLVAGLRFREARRIAESKPRSKSTPKP